MSDDEGGPKSEAEQLLEKNKFEPEKAELVPKQTGIVTGYPKPARAYRLHYEAYNASIEEPYFWILHYLRYYGGFHKIDKITDVFTASENSAFFGASQQRLGLQQDKVSQFLATVGKMVRELFQLVRELRVLDERLSYYVDAYTTSPSAESAEITLKGIWVDMVEQGAKNPASVYGMAREVQFTTLPDLFFSTHPRKQQDVDSVVEKQRGQFNRKVREVLKRKLRAFLAWKEHTFEEIKNRRAFTLKFLRQHFDVIMMYVQWVKPYLKNIKRLQMNQERSDTPDLVVAFESSMIEIELLAHKPGSGKDAHGNKLNQVLLMHFLYRTRPDMNYNQEFNRGPLHIGRVEMTYRAYAWSDKEIERYKKMKEEEDMQLLGMIDGSIRAALDALGDELTRYLREAGEDIPEKKSEKQAVKEKEKNSKKPSAAEPFVAVGKGLTDLFSAFTPEKDGKKHELPKKKDIYAELKSREATANSIKSLTWNIYHHFKKHHGMLSW